MEVISQLLPYVFVVWTETTLSPLADKENWRYYIMRHVIIFIK